MTTNKEMKRFKTKQRIGAALIEALQGFLAGAFLIGGLWIAAVAMGVL